ncbi:MAG TPA: hypothetical protein VMT18_12560 [Planctomycetota bacterium]|nr:hypothetical protein [Planctomycetota bacterium]
MHLRTVVPLVAPLLLVPLAAAQDGAQDATPPDDPAATQQGVPTAGPGSSQGTLFVTPGMPTLGRRVSSGQVTRFTNDFNPAFSFIIDAVGDWRGVENGENGADAFLRTFELGANAWVDPSAWAYFTAVAEDEFIGVEEAAVHYVGFGNRNTIRAGRFFIDFGKQMQTHVHDLRTLERPLVLREFLGAEVAGDGVQWDSWTTLGDATVVRWSLGAFASTLTEVEEDEFDPTSTALASLDRPKRADDFNYTARVTGFTEVGERGTLQLGTSLRAIPDFSLGYEIDESVSAGDLSNSVVGLDLTYGWVGETGIDTWTFGGEFLWNLGDKAAGIDDPDATPGSGDESVLVSDDAHFGWFGYGEYGWNRFNAVGLLLGQAEGVLDDRSELELYYSRMFSEFHRLRFVLGASDSDLEGNGTRLALQYTTILGAHGHGVNW